MAPKKAPKNAYFYYMLEYQRLEKAKGKDLSIPQVSLIASHSWQNLSEKQKEKYKQMANKAKEGEGTTSVAKPPNVCSNSGFTAQGLPLTMVMQQERQKQDELQDMKDSITKILVDGKKAGGIDKIVFHLIHMNMFYEDYPCEVAVCKFSINNGITGTYQTLIKVDKLPLGSAYEAKTKAEKTHGLPLPPNALGNDNHFSVLQNIAEFSSIHNKVLLFCRPEDMETIKNGLDFLKGGCASLRNNFVFFDFLELFYQMHKIIFCGEPRGELTYAGTKLILDRDIFDSTVKGCNQHDDLDRNLTCSESIVKRLAYQFIDTFVETFAIEQQHGLHMPHRLLSKKPEAADFDLESLVTEMTIDETSDETCDSESVDLNKVVELSMYKALNKTNPFIQDLEEETLNATRANQSVRIRRIFETFGQDSDFDLESHFDEDNDDNNTTVDFENTKFEELLESVRQNSCPQKPNK